MRACWPSGQAAKAGLGAAGDARARRLVACLRLPRWWWVCAQTRRLRAKQRGLSLSLSVRLSMRHRLRQDLALSAHDTERNQQPFMQDRVERLTRHGEPARHPNSTTSGRRPAARSEMSRALQQLECLLLFPWRRKRQYSWRKGETGRTRPSLQHVTRRTPECDAQGSCCRRCSPAPLCRAIEMIHAALALALCESACGTAERLLIGSTLLAVPQVSRSEGMRQK